MCAHCDRARASHNAARRRRDPIQRLYENSRDRARSQGLPFDLTPEDLRQLWPEGGRCPALGIPMRAGGRPRAPTPNSPSVDRLNPDWGYTRGNVAIISMAANRAKSNLRAKDLEAIAAWMRRQGLD